MSLWLWSAFTEIWVEAGSSKQRLGGRHRVLQFLAQFQSNSREVMPLVFRTLIVRSAINPLSLPQILISWGTHMLWSIHATTRHV